MRGRWMLGLVCAATACGSFPPPNETLANSMASIRSAEEAGAAAVPKASLSLTLAREELEKAKALMADGENEHAHYMGLRAIQDAELANALAREEKARGEANKAEREVEAIAGDGGKP